MQEFVHLHNHTHFSILDAVCTPDEMLKFAVKDNQRALAITDHGVMYGCYEFYKKAKKHGIKPIIGMEAYIANGSRFEKNAGKEKDRKKNYFHLVLLAKNLIGYKNLMKLSTIAHTEGFYYKPRIDFELLKKYSEGLIASTACIAGVINPFIISGDLEKANEIANAYHEVFGDDFYIELQNHYLSEDTAILREAPIIARNLGIKLLATNDIHYLKKEHAVAHNVHLFIRDVSADNAGQVDIYKLRYRNPEMYYKSQKEMIDLFKDFPESIESSVEIADKCDISFDKKIYMPEFAIPKDSNSATLADYLRELTYKGAAEKFDIITDQIRDRLEFELDVIIKMDFPGYFLIVQDFIQAAKRLGVRVGPGRGSAAGSLVAYALDITNVDPLPYDLLFERFLNPDRVSMPDIDIDFADDKRDRVLEYVKQKYSDQSVAQIITFGTLSTRAALTDVGRVLGINLGTVKEVTSKIPVIRGKVTPLADALNLPDLRWLKESTDKRIKEWIEFSLILEGKHRNPGTHAAGVVIAPGDVSDYVPVYTQYSKTKGQAVEQITQYTMNDLEDAGLLKMDFLGLRTLSIIDNTLSMIKKNTGLTIDIDKIDFQDEKTYDLLSDGHTLAVFQFESPGMQEYLKRLKPRNLEEITAMNALYRPGPMDNIPEFIDRKHGRSQIEYLHPLMIPALEKTYGIIVYQEQVMQLVRDIAGFSLSQADILRRAMGKKLTSYMDEQKPVFNEGAAKNGVEPHIASEIFDLIYKFADYGFNKSHSLAYSYLAYQTAWLKTHYPSEFLAANMTAEINDQDKLVLLIEEAKKFNIKVQPPDVNRSVADFIAESNTIFFGLAGVKNVGILAVDSIAVAREEKPFSSFFDFMARVDNRLLNKRSVEALVYSGAFDCLKCGHRAALFASIENAIEYSKAYQANKMNAVSSLFGEAVESGLIEPKIEDVPEWTEKVRLENEKEVLKFYISGNPIFQFAPFIRTFSQFKFSDKSSYDQGKPIRVCGYVTEVRTRLDKKNKTIAFVKIEDFYGKAECILWSKAFDKYGHLLKENTILGFSGKMDVKTDLLQIISDDVYTMQDLISQFCKGYHILIDLASNPEEDKLQVLTNKISNHSDSKSRLFFHVVDKSKNYSANYYAQKNSFPVSIENTKILTDSFGHSNVWFVI